MHNSTQLIFPNCVWAATRGLVRENGQSGFLKNNYAVRLYSLQNKRTPQLPTGTKFDLVPYMGNVIAKDH
jgi:hypothetical protein